MSHPIMTGQLPEYDVNILKLTRNSVYAQQGNQVYTPDFKRRTVHNVHGQETVNVFVIQKRCK